MLKVCSEGFCIFCKYCRTQWNVLYFCPPVSCTNIETWGNTRSFQSTFAMKHNILSAQCRHRPSLISTVTVTRDMGRMGIFHQNFKGFHGSHVHHQNIISYYVHRYLKVFCQLFYIYILSSKRRNLLTCTLHFVLDKREYKWSHVSLGRSVSICSISRGG